VSLVLAQLNVIKISKHANLINDIYILFW